MAASTVNVLSGILAAVAGLAGDKVSKNGNIPGLDLAAIVPALLGKEAGGASGLLGSLASMASKSGLLNSSGLGGLAETAGSLFSAAGTTAAAKKTNAGGEGIMGLASAIMGNSGKGLDLSKIAGLASALAGSAKSEKEVTGLAGNLGKTLSGSFGLSFTGGASALKALDGVTGDETKGGLLKTVLKALV